MKITMIALMIFFSMTIMLFSQSGIDYLPSSTTGQIIAHSYYTLSYSENHEQAEWVAYVLTRSRLNGSHERTDDYRADYLVKTGSAKLSDYKGSGIFFMRI